jgi:Sulfotransferase family
MAKGARLELSADQLMAAARELTGINIVDEESSEPLGVLVDAYNSESELREDGAREMQQFLLRVLCNRLRMQRDWAAHPEIAEEKIERPLIVYGMARSGTTKTQKLLAASGDFNWLPYWQTFNPAIKSENPRLDVQERVREAHEFTQWLGQVAPGSLRAHAAETFEPEEDTLLSNHFWYSTIYYQFAELPSYLDWLSRQDLTRYFEQLRDWLKYLQWQGLATGEKRWLLKSPIYYGLEPLILKVFPDADLVMTHRHPRSTVPSSIKLLESMQEAYSDFKLNPCITMELAAAQMDVHMDLRETAGLRILDINSVETHASADRLAERIYGFIDLPLSDGARKRVLDCDANNPKHKWGKFEYSLEEYGLTGEEIDSRFARYLAFLDAGKARA